MLRDILYEIRDLQYKIENSPLEYSLSDILDYLDSIENLVMEKEEEIEDKISELKENQNDL